MAIRGIERVKANFKRAIEDVDGRRTEGAVYAILSQGGAIAQTMTPVDTSNLINSQYAPQISQSKGKTTGTIGYTAVYAEAVHEAPGTLKGLPRPNGNGDFWDPNAEPGFLEKGFDELEPSIPGILSRHYKV